MEAQNPCNLSAFGSQEGETLEGSDKESQEAEEADVPATHVQGSGISGMRSGASAWQRFG